MNWCDEVLGFCDASGGGVDPPPTYDEVNARIGNLPMDDWVRAWREVCQTGLRDETAGICAFRDYFDRLSYDDPERGLAFIEAILANEPDDEVVSLLASGKVLGQLLVFHASRATTGLQELALRQRRLRWLMGGKAVSIQNGMVEAPTLRRKLLAVADEAAYRAWEDRMRPDRDPVDFAALSIADLAAAWVKIKSRNSVEIERDGEWYDLYDYEAALAGRDPSRALDLIRAILDIEDNPNLLGALAAGLLESLIPADDGPVVDSVVAEAARNPDFRALLGGIWFHDVSPEVAAKLNDARGGVQW